MVRVSTNQQENKMRNKNSWSNVSSEFTIELYESEGRIYDAHSDKLIPQITLDMVPNIKDESYELVIEFESSGYYDEGVSYGLPENCYPPESDEERIPIKALIFWHPDKDTQNCVDSLKGGKELQLELSLQDELFELFQDEMNEVEIEIPDHW